MNNRLFLGLVVFAAAVLIGWVYFKGKTIPAAVNKTVQVTPTPAGSNLGPPEDVSGIPGNNLEKGGIPSK